ncbi:MAG: hypothetical protein RH860_00535 [Cytophagales bacterium]
MTEQETKDIIKDFPIGSKLEIIKTNGDIVEVTLASHETSGFEKSVQRTLEVPELPPAITVQGKRWGAFRIEISEIVKIARIS